MVLAGGVDANVDGALDKGAAGVKDGVEVKAGHDQSRGNMQAGGNAQSQGFEGANRFNVLLDEGHDDGHMDAEGGQGQGKDSWESEIKILSWNVEGLNSEKKGNKDVSNFISAYGLIVLYETWTSKNSNVELSGYSKPVHSFRRFRNRRAKCASGGVLIYMTRN